MAKIQIFKQTDSEQLLLFLSECLPQSGRKLDVQGHHRCYLDVLHCFERFWIMVEQGNIIGTVALRKLGEDDCELKSLYLFQRFHGQGLGRALLSTAIAFARKQGYQNIYLDTISDSYRAIALYQKAGFVTTERYNQNPAADVFMVLHL